MCKDNKQQYFPAGRFQECRRTGKIARQVLWRQEIDSTNNWAKEYAGSRIWMEKGTDPDGTSVVTERRTRGKGLEGGGWTSTP